MRYRHSGAKVELTASEAEIGLRRILGQLFFGVCLVLFALFTVPSAFAGTVTLATDIKTGAVTVDASDTFDLDGYELDADGAVAINGTLDAGTGSESGDTDSTINVLGSWTVDAAGTFTNTGSTVIFDAASGTIQITSAGSAFNHLTLNDGGGSSVFELQDALDVNGNLLISGGTLDTKSGVNAAVSVAGAWTNNDTLTPRSGTVTFDGASSTILSGSSEDAFYSVIFGNGETFSVKTIDAPLDVDGNLTITVWGGLDTKLGENNAIQVAGTWTNNGGITPRTGTVTFKGGSATILSGSSEDAFYDVVIGDGSTAATKTLDAKLDVDHDLTIAANATLDTKTGENNAIDVAGNWSNSGTFTVRSSLVKFNATSGAPAITSNGSPFYDLRINDGSQGITFTLQDALDVDHDLTITKGTLDVSATNCSAAPCGINIGGNWTTNASFGNFTSRTGTVTFDGGSTQQVAGGGTGIGTDDTTKDFHHITISGSTLQLVTNELEVDGSLTINNGKTLDLNGQTLDLNGTLVNNGTVLLEGGETIGLGTWDSDSGLVKYDGTGSVTIPAVITAYYDLEFDEAGTSDPTFTLPDANMTVNGVLTVTDGTLAFDNDKNVQVNDNGASGTALSVGSGGSLSNTGTGNLTLGGAVSNSGTITFNSGGEDGDGADSIQIRSTSDGVTRNWQGTGTFSVTDVDMKDQTVTGGSPATLTCTTCTNSGNNSNWLFGSISVSGTAYNQIGAERTTLNSKALVLVHYNGSARSTYTTTTGGDGTFTFSSLDLASGDPGIIYLNDETQEGNLVYVSDGATDTGLEVIQNQVSIQNEAGSGVTNTNLSNADDGDDDIKYTVAGGNAAIASGFGLYVLAGKTYAPGGSVTLTSADARIGGTMNLNADTLTLTTSGTLDVDGTLTITTGRAVLAGALDNDGTINLDGAPAGADTMNIEGNVDNDGTIDATGAAATVKAAGNWDNTNGTFTAGNSTVTLDAASGTIQITSAGSAFNHLTLNDGGGSSVFELQDALDVDGNLLISGGTLDTKSGVNAAVSVAGTWTNNDTLTPRSGTVTFDGASTTILSGSSEDAFYHVTVGDGSTTTAKTIDAALDIDGNLTIAANATLDTKSGENNAIQVAGTWTNNGTFTPRTGTVTFDGAGSTILSGSSEDAFYDVTVGDGSTAATKTLDAKLDVDRNLTIAANATLDTKSGENNAIDVTGNWSNSGTFTARSGTVTFDGASGSVSTLSGTSTFYNFKSADAGKVLKFPVGVTTTVTNTFTITGASNNKIKLCGSDDNATCTGSTTNTWKIVVSADQSQFTPAFPITEASVKNSDATGSAASSGSTIVDDDGKIKARISTPVSNNTFWKFGNTLSGTVYTDEGTTAAGANLRINLLNNGSFGDGFGSGNYAVTNSSGLYTLSNVNILAGDQVIILVEPVCNSGAPYDGTCDISTPQGVVILLSDGLDKSDLDIYLSRVIIRNEYSGNTAEMTFNHFHQAFNGGSDYCTSGAVGDCEDWGGESGAPDHGAQSYVGYTPVSGGSGTNTLVFDSSLEVYIWPGTTFTPGTVATFDDVDIRGTLKGTTGKTFTVKGDWDFSNGTFTHGGAAVEFTSTSTQTLKPNGQAFNNLTFSGGGTYTFSDSSSMTVEGAFNLSSGTFVMDDDKEIQLKGDFTVCTTCTFTKSSGGAPLKFTATSSDAAQTIQANGKALGNIQFTGGGTYQFNDDDALTVDQFDLTSGTFVMDDDKDAVVQGNFTIADGTTFTKSSGAGKLRLEGDLTLTDGSATKQNLGKLVIGGSPDNVTLGSDAACESLEVTSANTLTTAGYDVEVTGTDGVTVSGILDASDTGSRSTTIDVKGKWEVESGATFTAGSSTVDVSDTGTVNITSNGTSFKHFTHSGSGTSSIQDHMNVAGTLALSAGTVDHTANAEITAGKVTISSGATWSHTGGGDSDNATITIGTGGVTNSGTITFNAKGGADFGGDSDVIKIRSSVPGTQVQWKGTGTYVWYDVDVKDSIRMSPAIECYSCTNSGNNSNINFHGVVDHFKVQTSADATLSAGGSIDISLQPYDNVGTVIGDYLGEKTMTFSGPGAAPDGTVPLVLDNTSTNVTLGSGSKLSFFCNPADGCYANTTLTLFKAETVSVDVSDGTYDSTGSTGYDLDLTVQPLSAVALKFTTEPAPATVTSKTDFTTQPAVSVVDTYENVVTDDDTSEVTLAAVLASDETTVVNGTLDADQNPLAVTDGAASFSGVNFDENASIKLKAASGTLAAALSQEITVVDSASTTKFTDVNGTEKASYFIGEAVYIQVTDADQNTDTAAKDTVSVTVTSASTGDQVEVILEETGVDTGIFMNQGGESDGPLPSEYSSDAVSGDYALQVLAAGGSVTAEYTDPNDSDDKTTDSATFGSISFNVIVPSSPVTAGEPFDLTIEARQGAGGTGDLLSSFNSQVSIAASFVSPGSGTKSISPSGSGLANFSGGVLTLSAQYDDAGTIQIIVTDQSDSSMSGVSSDLAFIPDSFEVAFDFEEAAYESGKEFGMTVTAKSASGAVTPNYAGPASIQAPAGGTLLASSTGSFSSGVASLTNRYDGWGSVSFTIEDGAYPQATGTSGAVFFNASELSVTLSAPPGGRTKDAKYLYYAGESFTVTVKALDYGGKTITGYGGKVNFETTGGFSIPSSHQFTAGDAGVHSFQVTTTKAAADFTIEASEDGGGVSGQSDAASVIEVEIIVDTPTVARTGSPVEVTVMIVDKNNPNAGPIQTDNLTQVTILFDVIIQGKPLSEDSLLSRGIRLPSVRTITLNQGGMAVFQVSSDEIAAINIYADPAGANQFIYSEPATLNIGQFGGEDARIWIRTWAEVLPPS